MLLEIHNLKKSFGGIKALAGVTFQVEKNTVSGLIGPNGSGKTTLFNVISGFLPADEGEIFFQGKRIDGLNPDEVAQRGLIRSFQIDQSALQMTVLENMIVASPNQIGEKLYNVFFNFKKVISEEKKNIEKACYILDLLEMKSQSNVYAGNLSGGQRKLLSLGRMLMAEPSLYLLDEPTAGINPSLINRLLSFLRQEILKNKGKTILIVEHNMKVISNICDKVVVFDSGKKIAQGTPAEIQSNEKVLACYLTRGKECNE